MSPLHIKGFNRKKPKFGIETIIGNKKHVLSVSGTTSRQNGNVTNKLHLFRVKLPSEVLLQRKSFQKSFKQPAAVLWKLQKEIKSETFAFITRRGISNKEIHFQALLLQIEPIFDHI